MRGRDNYFRIRGCTLARGSVLYARARGGSAGSLEGGLLNRTENGDCSVLKLCKLSFKGWLELSFPRAFLRETFFLSNLGR